MQYVRLNMGAMEHGVTGQEPQGGRGTVGRPRWRAGTPGDEVAGSGSRGGKCWPREGKPVAQVTASGVLGIAWGAESSWRGGSRGGQVTGLAGGCCPPNPPGSGTEDHRRDLEQREETACTL